MGRGVRNTRQATGRCTTEARAAAAGDLGNVSWSSIVNGQTASGGPRPTRSANHGSATRSIPSRWSIATCSLGAAAVLDACVTIEWSAPYCNIQDDGPAWAVYGVVPYERFSGVSSLVYDFQPILFGINLLVLWALCGAAALTFCRWAPSLLRPERVRVAAMVAIVGVALVGIYRVGLYSTGWWTAVRSLSDSYSYDELRPVGLSVGHRAYACTPSPFWFGPVSPSASADYCSARHGPGCP